MKLTLLSLTLLFSAVAGCLRTSDRVTQANNVPVAEVANTEYQKLYRDYRSLVVAAIKNNEEANLSSITDEYAAKTGKKIFQARISRLDPSGKWRIVLYKTDPNMSIKLPIIHYASSKSVHVHRGKDFVSCESNKTNGTYKDDIHIRIAIKK